MARPKIMQLGIKGAHEMFVCCIEHLMYLIVFNSINLVSKGPNRFNLIATVQPLYLNLD